MKELDRIKKKYALKKEATDFSTITAKTGGLSGIKTTETKPMDIATTKLDVKPMDIPKARYGGTGGLTEVKTNLETKPMKLPSAKVGTVGSLLTTETEENGEEELHQLKEKTEKAKDINKRLKEGDDSAVEDAKKFLRNPSGAREGKSSNETKDKVNAPSAKTLDLSQDKDEVNLVLSAIKKKKAK